MAPLLYKMDDSPPANTVRMLAHIIGLQLDLKDVDFDAMEHKSPEYLKLNPIGRVPVIVEGDFVVSDSHVIIKYLLTLYGADKLETLYPSDVRTRALIDQAMFFDTGVYFRKITLQVPTDYHKENIESGYEVLEAWLQNRNYIAADHLTLADLPVGCTTFCLNLIHKIDAEKFPRTAEWVSRLEQEDCFKAIGIPGAVLLAEYIKKYQERNNLT